MACAMARMFFHRQFKLLKIKFLCDLLGTPRFETSFFFASTFVLFYCTLYKLYAKVNALTAYTRSTFITIYERRQYHCLQFNELSVAMLAVKNFCFGHAVVLSKQ